MCFLLRQLLSERKGVVRGRALNIIYLNDQAQRDGSEHLETKMLSLTLGTGVESYWKRQSEPHTVTAKEVALTPCSGSLGLKMCYSWSNLLKSSTPQGSSYSETTKFTKPPNVINTYQDDP